MISRLDSIAIAACVAAAGLAAGAGAARAQVALDDDDDGPRPAPSSSSSSSGGDDDGARVGAGLRLRSVRVPQGLVELFVERAPGGSSEIGFGLEVARRKGDFEVQLGLQYDPIHIVTGHWIDKGDSLPADEPDYVEFRDFGWYTIEVTFLNHTPLAKQVALRYGGGAGLGILKGDIVRTDHRCTSSELDSCGPYAGAENVNNPYDLPPVMLVVNAIIGVQIRPIDNMFINIEGGLRTLPFFGTTLGYYF